MLSIVLFLDTMIFGRCGRGNRKLILSFFFRRKYTCLLRVSQPIVHTDSINFNWRQAIEQRRTVAHHLLCHDLIPLMERCPSARWKEWR
ncbi:unnamed protein product [Adineta ricciae]|uniref:Uncharacterized protein n=1 Tax=Adineta ricciae TaxID=249248 RepID=A0A814BV27_ADIRI|nr:unnamed protein product [Adineta ricciae]